MEKKEVIRFILDMCEISTEKELVTGLFNRKLIRKDEAVFELCGVEVYRTAWSDEMTESDIQNGIANAYSSETLDMMLKIALRYDDKPGCSKTLDFLHQEKARRELEDIVVAEKLQMA